MFFLSFWPEFLAYFSRIMCPATMQKYFWNGLRSTTMSLRGWFGLQIPQISIQHSVPHWVRTVLAAKWGPIWYYTDRYLISVYYDLKAYNIVNKPRKKHKKTFYLIYILAVMQLVYRLQLCLSVYRTLIPAFILKMEAVKWWRQCYAKL